jgi:hypothetical protein
LKIGQVRSTTIAATIKERQAQQEKAIKRKFEEFILLSLFLSQ